jgi:cytochrome c'
MHTHARRLGPAVLPLALGLALFGADGGRAANVPRPISGEMVLVRVEPDELTKYLHRIIRNELKVPVPSDRAVRKVRATAVLIASRAQNGRGARDPRERVALRDNALKMQKALGEGQLVVARKLAADLLDMSETAGDPRPVPLNDILELEDVERLMKIRRVGGLGFDPPGRPGNPDGIELKMIKLTLRPLTAAELDADGAELARAAAVTAGMADLLDAYAPTKKEGKRDPKDWKAHTDEMRAGAADLEGAAKARDAKGVRAAAVRLFGSCSACHEVFRE